MSERDALLLLRDLILITAKIDDVKKVRVQLKSMIQVINKALPIQ